MERNKKAKLPPEVLLSKSAMKGWTSDWDFVMLKNLWKFINPKKSKVVEQVWMYPTEEYQERNPDVYEYDVQLTPYFKKLSLSQRFVCQRCTSSAYRNRIEIFKTSQKTLR